MNERCDCHRRSPYALITEKYKHHDETGSFQRIVSTPQQESIVNLRTASIWVCDRHAMLPIAPAAGRQVHR